MADLRSLSDLDDRLNREDARAYLERAELANDNQRLAEWAIRYGRAALEAVEGASAELDLEADRRIEERLAEDGQAVQIADCVDAVRAKVRALATAFLRLSNEAEEPVEFDEIEDALTALEEA